MGSWIIFSPGDHTLQIKSLGVIAERKLATVSSIRPLKPQRVHYCEDAYCSLQSHCHSFHVISTVVFVCRSVPVHTHAFVLQCFGLSEPEEGGRDWGGSIHVSGCAGGGAGR